MRVKTFITFYFWIKVIFMLLGIYVYTKFTSLGDTMTYLTGGSPDFLTINYLSSTGLMTQIGILFYKFLRLPFLSCMPFIIVSWASIKYVLKTHQELQNNLFYLLILIPHFLLYTSVFSKEAISCIYGAILSSWVISFVEGKFRFKIIYVVGIIVCAIFKAPFLPFIFEGLFLLWITQRIHSAKIVTLIAISMWIFNIVLIYLLRDIIDEGAQIFKFNFTWGDPKSTREEDFFAEKYGVFKHLPYGMFISLWGPTFKEMLAKPAQIVAGLESLLMFTVYGALFLGAMYKSKFDAKIFWSFSFIIIGLLIVQYPYGIFNPGSAIRYRQNLHLIFACLLVYLYKRNKFNVFKKKPLLSDSD